ncbi:MAG: sulfite exporter TauE/SafE family protein [Flavobacteriales bacterium]|nr:sulfite exporter TauE/SafE family protein [Flavobacteriales bacterium]
MSPEQLIAIALCFFAVALAYSSVGHAGASGYLAIMALWAFAPSEIKTTSLLLNITVSAITAFQFIRRGYFDKQVFIAFVIFSIPMAWLGGYIELEEKTFKVMAACFLLFSATYMIVKHIAKLEIRKVSVIMSKSYMYPIGGVIGFISGLIGVGGGIFLSPILFLFSNLTPRTISGISALFILVNSILGLFGHLSSSAEISSEIYWWLIAVVPGGLIGSYMGSKKLSPKAIYILLTIILISAGIKMLLSI